MLDNTILSNGFGSLLKKLQENNIETTQEELSSLFFDTLNTNNATSITTIDFANSIQQTYGLKSNEEILEILTKVSENDGTKDNLSAVDFEKQAEIENEAQQILEEYDSEEWSDVEPIQKSRLFGSDTFVYTTSDGSTIEVKNSEGIEVKQNLITGEIVVIGANNASIELEEGANLTVVESIIEDIKANSGNETINVRGAHTTVVNIDGGKGNQNITIADGANVENISTGKGEDTINILSNASAGKINTGAGNDTINIENSTINNNIQTENMFLGWFSTSSSDDTINITNSNIQGKLKSGLGNDTINTTSSTLNGKISSGWGDDNITVNETEVNAKINADGGNDTIQITSSTVSQGNTVVAGGGTNNITIKDSNIDGALDAGLSTLNIENSTVKDLGYLNSQSNVTSTNSAIGSGAYTNIERVVTDLDTTAGSEFEGYELVSPSEETKVVYLIQDCTGKSRLVNVDEYICNDYETVITSYEQISFKLPDGSIVWANNDGGQVYVNSNGDVVLNGVNNANLTSNNSSKIIALNSNIIEHENIDCEVEYRNCIIENVRVAQNSQNANISTNNSNITNISVIDSSATINLNDTQVGNIIGRSQNENSVNVSINDGAIDGIKLNGSLGLNLEASEDASAFSINEITTQAGAIVGNINNANIDTIKTNDGSINLTANNSTINSVTNKNKEGETTIDFTNIQLDKIVSSAACDIQLNGCNVENKIKASNYDDSITVEESEVEKINSAYGQDLVEIYESEVESLSANGNTSIYGADIESLAASGNVAISNSEVNSFNASDSDNVYIKDSLVTTNVAYTSSTGYAANQQVNQTMPNMYIDNFDEIEIINNASLEEMQNDNVALARILEKETQNTQEVYSLLETLAPNEINTIVSQYGSLTQEEIISKILENPSDDLILIQEQLVLQMQGALKNLDNEIKNEKKSLGIISGICYVFDNDEVELEEKRELLEKAINSNDLGTILSTYTLLTDEVANAQMLSSTMSSLEYASSLDKDTASLILDTLDYIGNDLEYQMTSQDGLIKERIAYYNNLIGIGTNQREVQANLATYRQDVAELRENYLNGNLSNAEFAAEYKRITGNELNAENVNSLLDNVRGNDEFENVVEEKIEDYQETQQTVFQVGEYVVVIAAGAAVTLASGGAAGPAVAAALASFGQMGIALTATTVSLAVKIGMEATERQTNSIVADDMTPEEVAQTAALMYAGCLCGQFGNAMGKLIGPKTADFFAMYMSENAAKITTAILSKGLEFGSDTLASYATTAMITGSGEFSEEFMENLKSEFIGWLQSKITGAYFAKHPEIQINSQLYIARKNSQGASEQEVNLSILKQFGFSEAEALEYSHMSAQEVDTIVMMKYVNPAELSAILESETSGEELTALLLTGAAAEAAVVKAGEAGEVKLETVETPETTTAKQALYEDMLRCASETTQTQDNTCWAISTLNAASGNSAWLQAITNEIEIINPTTGECKIKIGSNEYSFTYQKGNNIIEQIYNAYTASPENQGTGLTTEFMDKLFPQADRLLLSSSNGENLSTVKTVLDNGYGIVTFNTGADSVVKDINGKNVTIHKDHGYSVVSVDEQSITLRTTNAEEIVISRAEFERISTETDGQFAGRIVGFGESEEAQSLRDLFTDETEERIIGNEFDLSENPILAKRVEELNELNQTVDEFEYFMINNMSDEVFVQYKKALSFGLERYDARIISRHDTDTFEKIIYYLEKGYSVSEAETFAPLSELQYTEATKLMSNYSLNASDASKIAILEGMQKTRATNLLNNGITPSNILKMVTLEQAQYDAVCKIIEYGVTNADTAIKLSEFSDADLKKIPTLLEQGFKDSMLKDLLALDKNKYDIVIKHANMGENVQQIYQLRNLDENLWQDAINISNYLEFAGAINLATQIVSNPVKFEAYKRLVKLDTLSKNTIAVIIANIPSSKIHIAASMAEHGIDAQLILDYTNIYSEDVLYKALEYIEIGLKHYHSIGIANNEAKYQEAPSAEEMRSRKAELIERNVDDYEQSSFLLYDQETYSKALELLNSGISEYSITGLSKNEIASASSRIKLGENANTVIRTINYTPEMITEYYRLTQELKIEDYEARELLTGYKGAEYERAVDLSLRGFSIFNLKNYLDDTNYSNILALLENGYSPYDVSRIIGQGETMIGLAKQKINGAPRFNSYQLTDISRLTRENDPEMIKFLQSIIDAKTEDGSEYIYKDPGSIISLLCAFKTNSSFTLKLLNMKNPNGTPRFSPEDSKTIESLVCQYNSNPEIVNEIINKMSNGEYLFNNEDLKIIMHASKEEYEAIKPLMDITIKDANGEQKPLAGSHIASLLEAYRVTKDIEAIKPFIIKASNQRYSKAQADVYFGQLTHMLTLVQNKDFINAVGEDNVPRIGKIHSALDAIVKLYKQVEAKPEKYIVGGNLSEQEATEQISSIFYGKDDSGHILATTALMMDRELFNGLLDMRLAKFAEGMSSYADLGYENMQIFNALVSSRVSYSITGKKIKHELNFNQKLDLLTLMATNNQDVYALLAKHAATTNTPLDLNEIEIQARDILFASLNIQGKTPDELHALRAQYDKMSIKEIAQLLTANIPSDYLEILSKSAEMGFESYIQSKESYVEANNKTKSEFAEAGLDYSKWVNPTVSTRTIQVGNQTMTIKVWDRNPYTDLLIGTKTDCCTSPTGCNAPSTPIYLTNTAFNVIELYDANGNAVAMSRIFIAKVNGQNALIMDNFETQNKTDYNLIEAGMRDEVRNQFFMYARDLANSISQNGEQMPIYISSNFVDIKTNDLTPAQKPNVAFVGGVSNDRVYLNCGARAEEEESISNLYVVPY